MSSDFSSFFKENKALLKEYLELRLRVLKLQGVRAISDSLSFFIWFIVVLFFVFFILLFLGILLALWIAQLTSSTLIGFASAAGIFTLLLVVVIACRKPLFQNPISRIIIKATANEEDADDED